MRIAADANVLLSALIGGSARKVLCHPSVEEVLTTEFTMDEVREYAGELAQKKGLSPDLVLLASAALPVTVVPRPRYRASLVAARRRMVHRDPDDVDLLALALRFAIPVWSNDNDFADAGVEWFTTATLLKRLDQI